MPVYGARPDAFNQGDIFLDVPFDLLPDRGEGRHYQAGMVLTNDCDLDKFGYAKTEAEREPWTFTIAPVDPIESLSGGRPKAARLGTMPRYFYLPDENGHGALVVDLWLGQPVRVVELLRCGRMDSLSDESRQRLEDHLVWLWVGPREPGKGARQRAA